MSNTSVVNNQEIATFTSQGGGLLNSLAKTMKKVNDELGAYLDSLRATGKRPVVSSISHSSGFEAHIGYHASLVAVIDW